jgi:hypothetical protein
MRRPDILRTLMALLALALPGLSHADTRVLCAFDPAGKSGDYYKMMQDLGVETQTWGTTLDIRAYTDEETAAKDYDAGHCDAVLATGVRLQRFNRFSSTIEAIGAAPTYAILKQAIESLNKYDSAAARLKSGDHETAGILPVGAVYLFLRDRNIDTVPELAGKRIATMDYDKAAPVMVDRVGGVMVPADLGSIGPKFNNGDVDAAYASAPAYKPFELWRGIGTKGGIVKLPLAQATLQLLIHSSKFSPDFGKKSRVFLAGKFDSAIALVKKAEGEIPASSWITIKPTDVPAFDEMFQAVRIQIRDEIKGYDPTMLSMLRKLRCASDATRPECVEQKE